MHRIYLGGRLLTFSVYPDFSFRDEWSGLFNGDEKILDYVAVKTEWGWAAPENANVEKTMIGRDAIIFTHEINGHPVRIKIARRAANHRGAELEQLVISVDGSKENELEVGICGRHAYDQNCGNVEINSGRISAGRNRITLLPESAEKPVAIDLGQRIHRQGDKEYLIRVVRTPFRDQVLLSVHHIPPRLAKAVPNAKASFHSDSNEWNELYHRARETIRILTKRRGWYAGLPWFVQYWGRDTFISLPALIREGYAPLARRALLDFLYSKVDGEIPRLIKESGVPEFGSIDANPLFLNAVADYTTISGDYSFISENVTDILEAFTWIHDMFDGYMPHSTGKDTWMDTLEMRKYPVEVAAYVVEATRKLTRLGVLNKGYEDAKKQWSAEMRKYLLERSANIILAAAYNLVPAEEAITKAKEWRLVTEWGVRSWSPLEAEYDPKGYHTGAIWGLTTAAGLYVALKAKDWGIAEVLVNALLKRANWSEYLDEVWNANTGEPIGADAQLWTAAMIIRAIDEIIIDRRCIPPGITKIRRVRWEKGRMKHISIG